MYKLTQPDGFDFYSGTINYRQNIGKIIRVTDFDSANVGPCGKGLHASRNPNDCFVGAKIPCAAFRVKGIQPIAEDNHKTRYQALRVVEEITDLDALFGWKYSEAINPVHPFKIKPPEITDEHIQLVRQWASVGDPVWYSVRASVRAYIGSLFPKITTWKYAPKTDGYPYQPCVDLWIQGLVSSYDGKKWRLHGEPEGKVLWTE
jgi:hypothetical protein